jgi:TRAP transporter TAXI family solute receptor
MATTERLRPLRKASIWSPASGHLAAGLRGGLMRLAFPLLALLIAVPDASAQSPDAARPARTYSSRINDGTLGVISGGADGTYIRIAADLSNVLDGENLRVIPMIGRGSLQNLKDIMYLRGTDIGIVQMDAREALKAEGLQERAVERLRYIARLYNEEVHLVAASDITDIRQLQGKKVNIDKAGSGTNLTARLIFQKLGVQPEFTTYDQTSSYERLRRGEVQAAMYVAGRPVRAIADLPENSGLHLLPIPFEGEIADSYFPAKFTASDYPRLVADGQEVNTLAVGSILAVFNWPEGSDRYKRVERFVNAFFSRFDEFLQPGRHPKWKEVSLTADVPGWQRTKPAQDWIEAASDPVATTSSADFKAFVSAQKLALPPEVRERLFQDFLKWQGRHVAGQKTSP